jgi:hypothetical protein
MTVDLEMCSKSYRAPPSWDLALALDSSAVPVRNCLGIVSKPWDFSGQCYPFNSFSSKVLCP